MRLSGSTLFAPLLCVPLVFAPLGGVAQPAARDGSHDFDFNLGVWKTHIRSIRNPLSDSNAAVEFSGTVSVRKVWGGRAQLEEIEADDPRGHWEGMSLFLYNPSAHQWSQTFVDSDSGVFDVGTIGSFEGGRGELYAQDTAEGRAVLVLAILGQTLMGTLVRQMDLGLLIHLSAAMLVAVLAILVGVRLWGLYPHITVFARGGVALMGVVILQLLLGGISLVFRTPPAAASPSAEQLQAQANALRPAVHAILTTAHQTTAAVLLAIATLLAFWTWRLMAVQEAAAPVEAPAAHAETATM